ncbi:MAG: ferrous iron transport protein B [Flavobacterium sp.]|nr:ferrous iron transport protein B [Candidatus Neoflavobacterium equi]
MKHTINIALIGNPNVGKTSVFNMLTGLKQKVGNYPGITVEKKVGVFKVNNQLKANILDLPGSYSINATSKDEQVVLDLLFDQNNEHYPDVVLVVADVENIKRNLLLFTQIKDLGLPTILAVNMADRMGPKGISLDIQSLEAALDTKVVLLSVRENKGFEELKGAIASYKELSKEKIIDIKSIDTAHFEQFAAANPNKDVYQHWLVQDGSSSSEIKKIQHKETVKRYQIINEALNKSYAVNALEASDIRSKMDRVLTHWFFGYAIFFGIMLLIFQSVFDWSSIPMDFIDGLFASLIESLKETLPAGKLTDLITDGVIAGINGVVIFIPQIAILFLFISLLEESGYMSRVVFLMDRIMRPFGLNGKSIVPLISGTACAIPAIMSARNIENWKERLITILITPFTTCSARIPVYVIIISLVVPDKKVFGFIGLQGLTMTGLYILGFFMAIISAWILNKIIKSKQKSYFVVEMPTYRLPLLKNVFYTVVEKTKSFVFGAGKIILPLSVLLWFLGTHGPGDNFTNAEEIITSTYVDQQLSEEDLQDKVASFKLESSYMGLIGKSIEPVVRPLGYDWKIGIAVIASFSAREVFVGTLATIYSVGSHADEEDISLIKDRMMRETFPDGTKVFTLATGVSILLFYAFAMQCISTVAITRKETNSLKWTVIQAVGMTLFAYIVSFVAYQLLK